MFCLFGSGSAHGRPFPARPGIHSSTARHHGSTAQRLIITSAQHYIITSAQHGTAQHSARSGATRGACIATRIASPTVPTRSSDDNIYEYKI